MLANSNVVPYQIDIPCITYNRQALRDKGLAFTWNNTT